MEGRSIYDIFDDDASLINRLIDFRLNSMFTAIPARIVSYNTKERTVVVQPLIQEFYINKEGTAEFITISELEDVPVLYIASGDFEITTPITEGDECLVIISTQCIDNWWKGGGIQPPFEPRKFNISDGFALVGMFSQKVIEDKKLKEPSTTDFVIRSKDETSKITFDKEKKNITFLQQTADDEPKKINELIFDKDGKLIYNIYKDDEVKASIETTIDHHHIVFDTDKLDIKLEKTGAITINSKEALNITNEKDIVINTKGKLDATVEKDVVITSKGKLNADITGDVAITSKGNVNISNNTCKIEIGAASVKINGALEVLP